MMSMRFVDGSMTSGQATNLLDLLYSRFENENHNFYVREEGSSSGGLQ